MQMPAVAFVGYLHRPKPTLDVTEKPTSPKFPQCLFAFRNVARREFGDIFESKDEMLWLLNCVAPPTQTFQPHLREPGRALGTIENITPIPKTCDLVAAVALPDRLKRVALTQFGSQFQHANRPQRFRHLLSL
jgi:hypothetical protein